MINIKIHDFQKSYDIGKQGEEYIIQYIKSLENVLYIEDVREDKVYQNKDIDIVVTLKNNTKVKVEIKTDTYDTGNIFYETMSCIETNSIGCIEKTQADLILYYFINTKELYIFDTKEYKKWFNNKKYNFTKKKFLNYYNNGTSKYTTEGFIIPKRYLEGSFTKYIKQAI